MPTSTPTATPTRLPLVTEGQKAAMNQAGQSMLERLTDLPGYDIQATLDMDALTLQGRQQVAFTNRYTVTLNEIYFNLYANAPRFGGSMDIESVAVNGQPAVVDYQKERRALRVLLDVPLEPGRQATIEMAFYLQIPQLERSDLREMVYSKEMLSLGGWYPMLAVLTPLGWHLDYAQDVIGEAMFADSAFYTVQITTPQSLVVAATGVLAEKEVLEDGWRISRYVSGPTRTFYLAASTHYRALTAQVGGTTIHSYYLPGDDRCARWHLESAEAALKLYSELFGPVYLAELDVVEADYKYQGMEWPGVLLIGDMLYRSDEPACGEWFVAHEMSHLWWYDLVGNDPVADPWLDEALAQYTTMLYYRRLWDDASAEAYIQAIIYDRFAQYADRPDGVHIGQPTTVFADRKDYYAITYAHGAMFIEQLHRALGDEAFFSALRQYARENVYGIATPQTLYDILHPLNPQAVESLWAEWVEGVQPSP